MFDSILSYSDIKIIIFPWQKSPEEISLNAQLRGEKSCETEERETLLFLRLRCQKKKKKFPKITYIPDD